MLIVKMLSWKINSDFTANRTLLLTFNVTSNRQRTTSKQQQRLLTESRIQRSEKLFCKELVIFHHLFEECQT